MKNMGSIISSHDKQILQTNDDNFGFNCRIKQKCPLENKCLIPNIVYEKKDIQELLKYHLRKDSENITEILSIKSMKIELSLQNIFGNFKSQGIVATIKWRIITRIESKFEAEILYD